MNEDFKDLDFKTYLLESAELLTKSADAIDSLSIEKAIKEISLAFQEKKALYVCGNGGSAADANHIHAELVGRFELNRNPFNVISLVANPAFLTAWSNDEDYDSIFSRQIKSFPDNSGVLLAISTSGNSSNIISAARVSRRKNIKVISLTGSDGGDLKPLSDININVPSNKTAKIQQVHESIYHYICGKLEFIKIK
tara:strand:+ start:12659 stop:13246 length:588 start_codon:yes stop_codon:yes gene_type:complete